MTFVSKSYAMFVVASCLITTTALLHFSTKLLLPITRQKGFYTRYVHSTMAILYMRYVVAFAPLRLFTARFLSTSLDGLVAFYLF